MKIAIIGTRGIPAKYGGFETFAEKISPLLNNKEVKITVFCDKKDPNNKIDVYKGVKLVYQMTKKSNSPLFFYLEGIWRGLKNNDIILVTGTGGAYFYLINIFFRKKIITNTDGVESRRAKWSKLQRLLIKISENLAVRMSHHLIADSKGIKKYLINSYLKLPTTKISVIEYGAEINILKNLKVLEEFNLEHKNYYLVVSRLEPENNLEIILKGYVKSHINKPLIIVGDILDNIYVKELLEYKCENIRFIGGIYNQKKLSALRVSAFSYIHGHSVGGTNPSLLEALGCGNISVCHDNIFNREVTNNDQIYFSNSNQLKSELEKLEVLTESERIKIEKKAINRIENYYTWENMASKYSEVFSKLLIEKKA